jgi:hypothetical protein
VHQGDDWTVGRAFVEVMDTKRAALTVGHFDVVRLERVAGQTGEPVVRGAQDVHPAILSHPGASSPVRTGSFGR